MGVVNEMQKRIFQSLAILGVNVVVGGLAMATFFLFLFRGDPILAAVPAVVALPAILVQPWFILFFFLPGGPFLAPILTTAVSIPIYVLLDRKGNRAKFVLARLKSRRAVVVIADKLGMHPIPVDRVGDTYRRMPTYWWRPVVSDQVRVLATAHFPMAGRGSDGWHALATWNPQDNVLHMWIKDNF
ncbi:MAG: hypothetical protein V1899_04820 [Planctomycetota bacterium]